MERNGIADIQTVFNFESLCEMPWGDKQHATKAFSSNG
jgi:hypothetical protein